MLVARLCLLPLHTGVLTSSLCYNVFTARRPHSDIRMMPRFSEVHLPQEHLSTYVEVDGHVSVTILVQRASHRPRSFSLDLDEYSHPSWRLSGTEDSMTQDSSSPLG
ncbi:hypothetical protein K474DRAFT_1517671 [Panus rudis PR-1116 ss-1]|nr:hypothetical protein K474DRAFT_1517671 [Panus rudis PR-1116 ss-1]